MADDKKNNVSQTAKGTKSTAPATAAAKYAASKGITVSNKAKNLPAVKATATEKTAGTKKKRGLAALTTTQVFMIALAGTLICVGGLWMLVLTREGDLAAERAAAMLRSFEPANLAPLEEVNHGASLGEMPDRVPYDAPEQPQYESEKDVERALKMHSNYKAIAKIYIEKLDLTLPILSESSTQALKISVCKFQGPEPLQPGNLVITGHHYKNGAHFGRLEQLSIDDTVIITDANGDFRRYFVYEMIVVQPDDLAALDTGKNKNTVTLVTCAENGEKRLLVKCRAI